MKLCALLVLCALMPGPPALAQDTVICRFDTVCFLYTPCAKSDWSMRFARDGGDYLLTSGSARRLFGVLGQDDGHTAYVSAPEGGAVAMLTLAEDGTAIYAEQAMSGGFAVTEYGTCRKEAP